MASKPIQDGEFLLVDVTNGTIINIYSSNVAAEKDAEQFALNRQNTTFAVYERVANSTFRVEPKITRT